jgi:hypothetical protein
VAPTLHTAGRWAPPRHPPSPRKVDNATSSDTDAQLKLNFALAGPVRGAPPPLAPSPPPRLFRDSAALRKPAGEKMSA